MLIHIQWGFLNVDVSYQAPQQYLKPGAKPKEYGKIQKPYIKCVRLFWKSLYKITWEVDLAVDFNESSGHSSWHKMSFKPMSASYKELTLKFIHRYFSFFKMSITFNWTFLDSLRDFYSNWCLLSTEFM